MMARWLSGISTAALALVLASPQAMAQLSGQVTSAEEGSMEGVVVSAKRADSNITVSVISNAEGRFTIPADRLPPRKYTSTRPAARLAPGKYTSTTRAVGYDLDGPKEATIAAGGPTSVDVKLRKTRDLSHQLTNAEWMLSVPGSEDDKLSLINCVGCHTHERIM